MNRDRMSSSSGLGTHASSAPLTCTLNALEPTKRERHRVLSTALSRACQEIRELPEGFAFSFPHDPILRQRIEEWVTYERICCGFLTLTVAEAEEGGPTWISATGRPGVKQFLRELGFLNV